MAKSSGAFTVIEWIAAIFVGLLVLPKFLQALQNLNPGASRSSSGGAAGGGGGFPFSLSPNQNSNRPQGGISAGVNGGAGNNGGSQHELNSTPQPFNTQGANSLPQPIPGGPLDPSNPANLPPVPPPDVNLGNLTPDQSGGNLVNDVLTNPGNNELPTLSPQDNSGQSVIDDIFSSIEGDTQLASDEFLGTNPNVESDNSDVASDIPDNEDDQSAYDDQSLDDSYDYGDGYDGDGGGGGDGGGDGGGGGQEGFFEGSSE